MRKYVALMLCLLLCVCSAGAFAEEAVSEDAVKQETVSEEAVSQDSEADGGETAGEALNYSKDIAAAVKSYLVEDDWKFEFDEEKGMFTFSATIDGKMKYVDYYVMIHEDSYLSYAISPMTADLNDAGVTRNINEFINRANYGMRNGNFELDMRDGEIRYKVYVNCDGVLPSKQIVKDSIIIPAMMFEDYSPGIVDVLFKGTDAAEAIELCEN